MITMLAAGPDVAAAPARRCRLLLVEPDSLVRRIVAGVARELELAEVQEASAYDSAADLLGARHFDAVLLALADDGRGIDLARAVRDGQTRSEALLPMAVMAAECDAARAQALRALKVQRVMIKPFKVKTVLETLRLLATLQQHAAQAD